VNVDEATEALGTPVQTAVAHGSTVCDYALGTDGKPTHDGQLHVEGRERLMSLTHTAASWEAKARLLIARGGR